MLNWSPTNRRGLLVDPRIGQYWGGHVNDVLEVADGTVLAAAQSGGVWLLSPGSGIALSMDWDAPDTTSLSRGSLGADHYLAGGVRAGGAGALHETDILALFPLSSPWREIALPAGVGAINRIAVDQTTGRIVLATASGLWSGTLSAPGTPLSLTPATGTAADIAWTDVVIPTSGTCVAVTQGADDGSGRFGFFVGGWAGGHLTLSHVRPAPDVSRFQYTTLAVAPSVPGTIYAAGCDNDNVPDAGGTLRGLIRSRDGGHTWEARTAIEAGTSTLIADWNQVGWDGAIAVSPNDPNVVVLGYTAGPYVSRDGGNNFNRMGALTHPDKHRYVFTPAGRLYEASDGGVVYTDDLGTSFNWGLNEHIANLQFLGPSARQWWGRVSASNQVPKLVGGGLQDNGDVYTATNFDGSTSPWLPLPGGGDGQSVYFLADGTALFSYGDVRQTTWVSGSRLLTDGTIPVRHGRPGVNYDGGVAGLVGVVQQPQWRDGGGNLMKAVLVSASDAFGLFDDGGLHWNYLGSLQFASDEEVSAVSSLTGNRILVGVRGRGGVYSFDPGDVAAAQVSSGFPSTAAHAVVVVDIEILRDDSAFVALAAYGDWDTNVGGVYRTDDGLHWAAVGWEPGEVVYCMATTRSTSPRFVFAATDEHVYVSTDDGSNWTQDSNGLPARAHCSDLTCVDTPDGFTRLYLGTFGWSVWEADVARLEVSIRQTTDRGVCREVFGQTEVIPGETASFEAVVRGYGISTVGADIEWTVSPPATVVPAAGRTRATIVIPSGSWSLTLAVTVTLPGGRTVTASETLVGLTPEQVQERLLICHVRVYLKQVARIPPYLILNRAGPDPGPIDRLIRELRSAETGANGLIKELETFRKAAPAKRAAPTAQRPAANTRSRK